MMMISRIVDAFSFWYAVLNKIKNNEKLKLIEYLLFGGRGSAKTTSFFIIALIAILELPPGTFGLLGLRASKQNVKRHMLDCCEILKQQGIKYKYYPSLWKIVVNNQEILFYGANPNDKTASKWSGIPRMNVKYLFVWLEEASDFTQDDYSGITGTMRTANGTGQIVYVMTMNPWSSKHWLVSQMLSQFHWSKTIMSSDSGPGYMVKIIGKRLIHYSNWRCNKEYQSPNYIQRLKDMWKYNPRLAMVSDWGAPGYEAGRIYSHCLHKIGRAKVEPGEQYLLAGMDYGWGLDDKAGVTACVFGTATLENGVDLFAEYVQDNRKNKQDVNITCLQIVEFYKKCMYEFMRSTNSIHPYTLQVRVDNSAIGVIQILQNIATSQNLQWLQFVKCVKQPINDRIEITLWLMGTGRFRMSPYMKLLRSEFEDSFYLDTEKQKRSNTDDHAINAYEYSIEPLLYKFNVPITNKTSRNWINRNLIR